MQLFKPNLFVSVPAAQTPGFSWVPFMWKKPNRLAYTLRYGNPPFITNRPPHGSWEWTSWQGPANQISLWWILLATGQVAATIVYDNWESTIPTNEQPKSTFDSVDRILGSFDPRPPDLWAPRRIHIPVLRLLLYRESICWKCPNVSRSFDLDACSSEELLREFVDHVNQSLLDGINLTSDG